MGQRDAFTSQDIIKLNKMYKCPKGSILEGNPPVNAHNNIEALIGDAATTEHKIKTTTTPRPSRPFLQAVGNLALQAGQALLSQRP